MRSFVTGKETLLYTHHDGDIMTSRRNPLSRLSLVLRICRAAGEQIHGDICGLGGTQSWRSVEHFMQAKKYEGCELERVIQSLEMTEEAHMVGCGPVSFHGLPGRGSGVPW